MYLLNIIEVVELNDSIDLLTKKLTEAEDCRAQLIKARQVLNLSRTGKV